MVKAGGGRVGAHIEEHDVAHVVLRFYEGPAVVYFFFMCDEDGEAALVALCLGVGGDPERGAQAAIVRACQHVEVKFAGSVFVVQLGDAAHGGYRAYDRVFISPYDGRPANCIEGVAVLDGFADIVHHVRMVARARRRTPAGNTGALYIFFE